MVNLDHWVHRGRQVPSEEWGFPERGVSRDCQDPKVTKPACSKKKP